jgi:tetratricopeptide (TPR) repeat protein
LHNLLKNYDEAISDLQQSVELLPLQFGYRAYGIIGLIHHNLGQYDKALEAFETSISYNRDERADIYYYRGETHTALEDYDAAINDYLAALSRFSDYDRAYQGLGYAYYKTAQYDQALEALNEALEISPNSVIAHFYLGLVHLATDQFDDAEAAISQATNSITTLSEEEQEFVSNRVVTDLETFAQENPDQADDVETLIDLISEP